MALEMMWQIRLAGTQGRIIALSYGTAMSWEKELYVKNDPEPSRSVTFILENHPHETGQQYLSVITAEEETQLELTPEKRSKLEEWKVIPIL
jgi:hypothetical protein